MAATEPASRAGSAGAELVARASLPSASLTERMLVANARSASAAEPEKRTSSGSAPEVWTRRPAPVSRARRAATVAAAGPKRDANWPAAR